MKRFKYELKDLWSFDQLIVPQVLTPIYWIVIGIVILNGLSTLFMVNFFSGLIAIVGGIIFTRIIFEMIIVIFRIDGSLKKLVDLKGASLDSHHVAAEQSKKPRKSKPEIDGEHGI